MSEPRNPTNDPPAAKPQPPRTRATIWHLPNQLTVARLVLSVIFFVVLAFATEETWKGVSRTLLNLAFVLFVCAVVTDFLDGYLARRWNLTSTFGRIADPFADKIVICGGFVMLTGMTDLVQPWFAVVVMFREFLVSGLRSFLESKGVAFGAALSGKLKMFAQSIAIPAVLFYEANLAPPAGVAAEGLAMITLYATVGLLWLTLILTVGSCIGYLQRAYRLIRES